MKTLIILASALTLAACVTHDFNEGRRTNWRCDGDKRFSLREVAGTVEVYASGQTHRLSPAGDGVYSSGAITYTVQRGRASLTGVYNGPFENCRRTSDLGLW